MLFVCPVKSSDYPTKYHGSQIHLFISGEHFMIQAMSCLLYSLGDRWTPPGNPQYLQSTIPVQDDPSVAKV